MEFSSETHEPYMPSLPSLTVCFYPRVLAFLANAKNTSVLQSKIHRATKIRGTNNKIISDALRNGTSLFIARMFCAGHRKGWLNTLKTFRYFFKYLFLANQRMILYNVIHHFFKKASLRLHLKVMHQ